MLSLFSGNLDKVLAIEMFSSDDNTVGLIPFHVCKLQNEMHYFCAYKLDSIVAVWSESVKQKYQNTIEIATGHADDTHVA